MNGKLGLEGKGRIKGNIPFCKGPPNTGTSYLQKCYALSLANQLLLKRG